RSSTSHHSIFDACKLPANLSPNFGQKWILGRLPAHVEVGPVRLAESLRFHPFPGETLVIVHMRQIAECGLLIEEQRHRLTTPLNAPVELGIGLRELRDLQIGASKVEVPNPSV